MGYGPKNELNGNETLNIVLFSSCEKVGKLQTGFTFWMRFQAEWVISSNRPKKMVEFSSCLQVQLASIYFIYSFHKHQKEKEPCAQLCWIVVQLSG